MIPAHAIVGKSIKNVAKEKPIVAKKLQEERPYTFTLSIRDRNALFLERIFSALQFDRDRLPESLKEFKSAFTYKAVREINEAIVDIWPPETPIYSVLQSTKADVSGLYVGEYEPELVLRGVSRHSLYANKILLVDPFIYPLSVREAYNPILHPERYRSQTLRNVHLWLQLAPWIGANIVEFIRTPADFDRKLNWESMQRQKRKFEMNKELKEALERTVIEKVREFETTEGLRMLLLSAPDEYIRKVFRDLKLARDGCDEETFINHIHDLRREDPYYLEPTEEEIKNKKRGELHMRSSGASYEIAKLTSTYTGSYLVTDLHSRWKEIELDRLEHQIPEAEWSPLAKAFQNLELKYLNNVRLEHALALRKEGRLQPLRVLLKHVWTAACSGNPYGTQNVQHLAEELEVKVKEAEEEWKQIDRDLIKWLGGEVAAALVASPSLIETGHAGFLAAAFAVAGISTLTASRLKRKGFPDKFPAAFFMELKKARTN